MKQLDGAILEFIAESDEILQRVSGNLNQIEQGHHSSEMLDELYRDMHTMKGSAYLFGLREIGNLAHVVETCLDPIRSSDIPPNARMLDALFACVALIEKQVEEVRGRGEPVSSDELQKVLGKLFDSVTRQFGSEFSPSKEQILPLEEFSSIMSKSNSAFKANQKPETTPIKEKISEAKELKKMENSDAEKEKGASTPIPAVDGGDTTIRVHVGLLDTLMNLVGEMVLVRNQVLQHSGKSEDLEFLNLSKRLDVVTSELQDQVMKTRMQPIGNVLGKFQRLIRDLGRELDKKIDLTLQGKETELDKTLLEAIKDPLTHIVRNACDHGIENSATRTAAGKPETGHVLIRSFHEGGQVIVEISDDGNGLNRQKIVKKAVDRGILTQEAADKLPDRDKLNLIFHPGLSTADQVSAVSGRGVGMDVVKTNIEKIGGSVELDSIEGRGSTVRLRIPLTLAIVPAMLVRSESDLYAIPQIKLVELVRVEQSQDGSSPIQYVQGKPVYELRGKLLPLIDLKNVLKSRRPESGMSLSNDGETINIVVLNSEGDYYGLIVDEVLDTADIVVKPISKFLKSLEVFSAATILGSGRVALIIDPVGVAKISHLSIEKKNTESDFHGVSASANRNLEELQEFLFFRLGAEEIFCMPLAVVSRLEEFSKENVEFSGDQMVIQYRDTILPLFRLSEALGLEPKEPLSDQIPTVVVQRGNRWFGLMVDEILDVNSSSQVIDDSVRDRFGVFGNIVQDDQVVVVVDAIAIIEREVVRVTGQKLEEVGAHGRKGYKKPRVLYAEDVGFFRRQVSKLLTANGYEVVACEDGQSALEAFEKGKFDVVLSDIEMPRMNGYKLAEAIRSQKQYENIPLIALTTKFSKKDIDQGMKSGFNSYLEKLNPDLLLTNLNELLNQESGKGAVA